MSNIVNDILPFMKGDHDGVVAMDVVDESKFGGLILDFKGSKQAIPDDEDTTIVAIQILGVVTMVGPMMRRCVETK